MTTRLLLAAIFLFIGTVNLMSQDCNTLALAFPDVQLAASTDMSNTANRSGVAFHPLFQLYYSVNAGSSNYPIDAYDASGTIITSPAAGFDYRGAWYNPTTTFIEGNGFNNNGVVSHNLAPGTGNPTGTVTALLLANQPDSQSNGDIDPQNNYLIYYFDGAIYRYARTDNSFVDSISISGLPDSTDVLNNNSIVYVGCPNQEYAVYNHQEKRLLYIDQSSGAYNGFTQLPVSAPAAASFNMSYANNRLFLFNRDDLRWESYFVTDAITSQEEVSYLETSIDYGPNPVTDQLTVRIEATSEASYRLELFSLLGQPMGQWPVSAVSQISLGHLPAGTYVARITDANTGLFSRAVPLIKQ